MDKQAVIIALGRIEEKFLGLRSENRDSDIVNEIRQTLMACRNELQKPDAPKVKKEVQKKKAAQGPQS
jgi:hypothetical protein